MGPAGRRVAGVLARCRGIVCDDTGLMHLVAAVGVPTVGIFGHTSAAIDRPPLPGCVGIGGEDRAPCPHRVR